MPIADHRFVTLPLLKRIKSVRLASRSPAVWWQRHYCQVAGALIFSNRYDGVSHRMLTGQHRRRLFRFVFHLLENAELL
jgi:hypothetical protein